MVGIVVVLRSVEEERSHTNEGMRQKGRRGEGDWKNGERIVRCVSIDDIDGTGSAANSGEGGLVTLVTIVTLVPGRR